MSDQDFFAVPRTTTTTSAGDVELPILYHDVSIVQAFFRCDLDRVAPKLAGTGLLPARFLGGTALVGVAFFEYRETSIGSYNEAAIAVAAVPAQARAPRLPSLEFFRDPRQRTVGMYILDLPVTTEAARAAGREIWGYPKFLTEIPFRHQDGQFDCAVDDPAGGEPLLALRGALGRSLGLDAFHLTLYSNHRDQLVKTVVDVRCPTRVSRGTQTSLAASPGDHRMAANARDLGLVGATPLVVQVSDAFQSRLNDGESIGPWETPPIPYADTETS